MKTKRAPVIKNQFKLEEVQEQKEREEAAKKLEKMNAAKEREKRVREELQAKEKKARQAQSFVDQIDQFESKVFPHAASESPTQNAETARNGDSYPTTDESPRSSLAQYQQKQTTNPIKSSTKQSFSTPNDVFPLSESDKTHIVDFIQRAKMDPFTHLKTLATKLPVAQVSHQQTAAYLASIKAQKGQEEVAKKERDLRRRKLLLSEQVAQEDLEKIKMEELMAQKLQRHSKQERRIAEQ